MKRRFRLTRSSDFQRVRQFGKSYAHPLMVLITSPNQEDCSRFGVAAGRTVGNAVQRNRAKRLIRAASISFLNCIEPGWDLVLIARRPLSQSTYDQTYEALSSLLLRAELLLKIP